MPNRAFWSGLGTGVVLSTIIPHVSFWGGYFGAMYDVPQSGVNLALVALLIGVGFACYKIDEFF